MFENITGRCLKCKKPRCSDFCPVHTQIPEIIRLYESGESDAAAKMLFDNNPFSAVTSIVCPHERNCSGNCVRGVKGEPVEFYKIEEKLSYDYLFSFTAPEIERNGKKIAVIGAGPAGITASILLALRGFDITLIEAHDKIGGVLRYGIPEFRLPKTIVDRYESVLRSLSVRIKPNVFVGSTVNLDDMFTDGYSAIFIAVGTVKPNKLGLLGETLGHAHYAIDFLRSPDSYALGKKVVVIGAGNVAIDAARMAVRKMHGGGTVTVINNRRAEDMTGNRHEIDDAVAEGVLFTHLLQSVRIMDDKVRCTAVDAVETDGGIVFEEDFSRISDIEADTVIIAIGQGPQGAVMSETNIIKTGRGLVEANEDGRTNIPGVFAAGDIVSGPKTVVDAVAFAKKAAAEIEKYILGTPEV